MQPDPTPDRGGVGLAPRQRNFKSSRRVTSRELMRPQHEKDASIHSGQKFSGNRPGGRGRGMIDRPGTDRRRRNAPYRQEPGPRGKPALSGTSLRLNLSLASAVFHGNPNEREFFPGTPPRGSPAGIKSILRFGINQRSIIL